MPTLKLDATIASKLVELLSSDDDFRKLFESDTVAALVKVGQEPTDELQQFVKTCCSSVKLADKATISKATKQITAMLTSGANHNVPMLDADFQGGRTLK